MKKRLSHINEKGEARMVDISGKAATSRRAVARASVHMQPETLAMLQAGNLPKGDVLSVARTAAIMAVKRTPDLIPLCHPLPVTGVTVEFAAQSDGRLDIDVSVKTDGKTGVEMEALTGATIAALTVYDMIKAVEKGAEIGPIVLLEKEGGKSGKYKRGEEA